MNISPVAAAERHYRIADFFWIFTLIVHPLEDCVNSFTGVIS